MKSSISEVMNDLERFDSDSEESNGESVENGVQWRDTNTADIRINYEN